MTFFTVTILAKQRVSYSLVLLAWPLSVAPLPCLATVYGELPGGLRQELTKLIPTSDPPGRKDFFGGSVAISDSWAIVGADQHDGTSEDEGSVYVFQVTDGDTPTVMSAGVLEPPPILGENAQFGCAVDISGTSAMVGAWNASEVGAAYLYSSETGQRLATLRRPGSERHPRDDFGYSVAIDGNRAIVGAPGVSYGDINVGPWGRAYLLNGSGGGLSELTPTNEAAFNFGASVAISPEYAMVGAPGRTVWYDTAEPGAVYVFDAEREVQLFELTAGTDEPDAFGFSVAVDGNWLVVGAPYANNEARAQNTGAAYVYSLEDLAACDPETPERCEWTAQLYADDGMSLDLFGASVAVAGSTVIVGSPLATHDGDFPGAAYLFDIETGGRQFAKLIAGDNEVPTFDAFGAAVDIYRSSEGDADTRPIAIVGALQEDDACPVDPPEESVSCNSGAAYLFDASPPLPLQAGDADRDLDFDQFDLIQVQKAAKYKTGQQATWGEGDWDGAPGGWPGSPPVGNGLFDQFDIIASQRAAIYLSGPYPAVPPVARVTESLGVGAAPADVDRPYVPVPEPVAIVLLALGLPLVLLSRWVQQMGGAARRATVNPAMLSRLLVICGVVLLSLDRSHAAQIDDETVRLIVNAEYDRLCTPSTSCTPISDDRFNLFFGNTSWKATIDPEGVEEAQFDVSFSPNNHMDFVGVRYVNGYYQVGRSSPVVEEILDADGVPTGESVIRNIHVKTDSPPDANVDMVELIFSHPRPVVYPEDVTFAVFATSAAADPTTDRDDFVKVRDVGEFTPRNIIRSQASVARPDRLFADGRNDDNIYSIIYSRNSGELRVDAPGNEDKLTALNIESAQSIFDTLAVSADFTVESDRRISTTAGTVVGSDSLGNVAQAGLSEQFLLSNLTITGLREAGGAAGIFDLIVVDNPEPSTMVLSVLGAVILLAGPVVPKPRRAAI